MVAPLELTSINSWFLGGTCHPPVQTRLYLWKPPTSHTSEDLKQKYNIELWTCLIKIQAFAQILFHATYK